MKLSVAVSTVLFALPLLVQALPSEVDARAFGRQRFGGRQRGGGNNGQNRNGNAAAGNKNAGGNNNNNNAGGAAAATATAAAGGKAAASATSAAAAASTSVNAVGQAQKGASINDPQNSLQLDPSQVMTNLASDGQAVAEAGQVPSATSKNNFINFCLTRPQRVLTNGEQVVAGSCNPVVMGDIVAKNIMPAGKFVNPKNLDTIQANTPFTIQLAIQNLQTGNFVNPQTNYYAAPAQCGNNGILIGHSHVVVQQIKSLTDTSIPDPTVFQFFKGFNVAAQGGILSADVTAGLAAGTYRMCSIHTAANHQPALGAVAQHGMFDDCSYFTVSGGGGGGGAAANTAAAASSAAAAANTAKGGAAASSAAAATNTAAANTGKGGAAAAAGTGKAAAAAASSTAKAASSGKTANQGAAGQNNGAGQNKAAGSGKQGGRGRAGRGRGRGRY